MKITFIKSDLVKAISNVKRAVAKKSTIPSLEGILLTAKDKSLTLEGWDLELGIVATVEEVIIQEEGEIVIPAEMLFNIVNKAKDMKISLETNEYNITVKSGKSRFKLVGMSPKEFPALPKVEEKETVAINGEILKTLISQTKYAISDNNSKPVYTGSLFEFNKKTLTVVAIDGYRMGICTEAIDSDLSTSIVIPGKTQEELIKIINKDSDIRIAIDNRFITLSTDNYKVYSRIIEGTFLDYESLIKKEAKTTVKLKTIDLLETVERFTLITQDKIQSPLRLTIGNDLVSFSIKSVLASAEDELTPLSIEGESLVIGFNLKYFIEGLRSIDSDEVILSLSTPLSPMIITPSKGDNQLAMVVPMRIS